MRTLDLWANRARIAFVLFALAYFGWQFFVR